MEIELLITDLSQFGTVQVCKAGAVFTLLMTGIQKQNMKTLSDIQMRVLEFTGKKYSFIEAMKNDLDFLLIVLKP